MKKFSLLIICLFAFTSLVSAAPKFGLTIAQSDGIGVYVVHPHFNGSITLDNYSDDVTTETSHTDMVVSAKLKRDLTPLTEGTLGVRYFNRTGKLGGTDYETNNSIGLTLGIVRTIMPNLLLTMETNIVTVSNFQMDGGTEISTTSIAEISNGLDDIRMGIVHLF